MNEFLKTRAQITAATDWLKKAGYVTHPISAKDWELANATVCLFGDILDMGADGSRVLHNAVINGSAGRKVGIDLAEATGDNKAEGAEYYVGDIMNTPFGDSSFNTLTCLSVLEHQVDAMKLAKECGRLLRPGGKLIISFDFWEPKPNTEKMKLYALDWNILDKQDVLNLVLAMDRNGLSITTEIDWTTKDAVINEFFCSPVKGVEYSFGILEFVKQ